MILYIKCDYYTTDHLDIEDLTAEGVSGRNGITGKTGPDFNAGPGAYVVVSTNDGAMGTATVTAEADPDEGWTRNSGDAVSKRSMDGHDRTVDRKRSGRASQSVDVLPDLFTFSAKEGPMKTFDTMDDLFSSFPAGPPDGITFEIQSASMKAWTYMHGSHLPLFSDVLAAVYP